MQLVSCILSWKSVVS